MSSDLSRQRFDSKDNFSAVLMQQGRVLLDADWNEWMEILSRRWRAETVDLVGRAVLPRQVADQGFEITWGQGTLLIGRGRIYVAGLLAENHGYGPLGTFDPVLADLYSKKPVPFEAQYPALSGHGEFPGIRHRSLVYLDVWDRELTAVERPDLVEPAVGVDSTARLQTAWQVRLLANIGEANCGDPIPQWNTIVAPSAGRLSTDTVTPPDNPDPCVVPPSGGYRGLENRLYRVEIHDSGVRTSKAMSQFETFLHPIDAKKTPASLATFKWARHNASIATRVVAVTGSTLKVELTMRDGELRFSIGDWVEVINDEREFARTPGELRRLTDVDDTGLTLMLHADLPADLQPDVSRNLRVRKWDQKGRVLDGAGHPVFDLNGAGSHGAIPITHDGATFLLEDGIRITFNLAALAEKRFHVADYWVFAARTEDASIEILEQAPPRGVHHHYCRLAIVTPQKGLIDCRPKWPETTGDGESCCCCTVCVSAEQHNSGQLTIQDAIDRVVLTGGTVCLGPGLFFLPPPDRQEDEGTLVVTGANAVKIRGHGPATVLVHRGLSPALSVSAALGFTLEDVAVFTLAAGAWADVELWDSAGVTVQRCYFIQAGQAQEFDPTVGVAVHKADTGPAAPVARRLIRSTKPAIGLGGFLLVAKLRDNVFFAGTAVGNLPARSGKATDRLLHVAGVVPLLTLGLQCEDNLMYCRDEGISLGEASIHVGETRLAGNEIIAAATTGIRTTGLVLAARLLAGSNLDIVDNTLFVSGDGIVFGTSETRVTGNDVSPLVTGHGGDGIVVEPGAMPTLAVSGINITANRVRGLAGTGIGLNCYIGSAEIAHNTLEQLGAGGIVMLTDQSFARQLTITQNRLFGLWNLAGDNPDANPDFNPDAKIDVRRTFGNYASASFVLAAIDVSAALEVVISGNLVEWVAVIENLRARLAGISVNHAGAVRIAANQLATLGSPKNGASRVAGIFVGGTFVQLDVVDNLVRRGRTVGPDQGAWQALVIRQPQPAGAVQKAGGLYDRQVENLNEVVVNLRSTSSTGIRGNSFECSGYLPFVLVETGGDCLFADNRIQGPMEGKDPQVVIATRSVIFNANYVTGDRGQTSPAVDLQPLIGRLTVLGNITTGPVTVFGNLLPAPWDVLNSLG